MSTPPTAGPAIMPNSPRSESSAEAAVSSSRVTSARDHRVERRPLEAVDCGHERRDDEEDPHLRLVEKRVEKEDRGREPERELGELQHAPAIYSIGESPADERRYEQRNQRGQAEKADRQRRPVRW